jgi:hypothetical protein
MKVVFKIARSGNADPVQRHTPPPVGHSLAAPVSPAPVTSPGAPTPKPGRFVIKSNTILPTSSPAIDLSAPRASPFVFKSAIDLDADLDGRGKKRDNRIDVDFAPVPKRRKEVDLEDDMIDVSGAGAPAERTRKKWVPMRKALNIALKKLIEFDGYKFFYEPVSEKDAPGYFQVIKQPMDFVTMRKKLNEDKYPYWSLFTADFELICQNCITYNPPDSIYWTEAKNLLLEGKKYLKIQGTKINPDLLQPPGDFNASSLGTSATASSNTLASHHDHRPIPVLEMPKRIYIKNQDLPLHLLAPPPPVHIINPSSNPHGNTSTDPNSISTTALYPHTNDLVAQHTPQEQRLQPATEYPLFTIGPSDSSHWSKSIPTYIQHTRGHPIGGATAMLSDETVQSFQEHFAARSKAPDSLSSRWFTQQQHYYDKVSSNNDRKSYRRRIESFSKALSDEMKHRLADLGQVLSSHISSIDSDAFSRIDGTKDLMDIDTSSLDTSEDPLSVPRAVLSVDLKSLKTTLSGTHLDLSFIDKILKVDSSLDPPAIAMTTKQMLERNASLIQQLSTSMQSRRLGTPASDMDQALLAELSANMMTLCSHLPPASLHLRTEILEQARIAVRMGLPSIPGARSPVVKMET